MNPANISFILVSLLLYFSLNIQAQQAAVATGGDASSTNGTISYSIGQVAYLSGGGSGGKINEGVQQPFEIFVLSVSNKESLAYLLNVFPNPTTNNIILEVKNFNNQKLTYKLIDIQGKIIESKSLESERTQIDMNHLSAATYFIYVSHENMEIKSFKIIKN